MITIIGIGSAAALAIYSAIKIATAKSDVDFCDSYGVDFRDSISGRHSV